MWMNRHFFDGAFTFAETIYCRRWLLLHACRILSAAGERRG